MNGKLKFALSFLAVILTACSNPAGPGPIPSPTPSTGPTLRTLTLYRGQSSQVVSGARVIVDGQTYTSDQDGRVQFTASANADVDATVGDTYLDRNTTPAIEERLFGPGRMELWVGANPAMGKEYEHQLVYHQWAPNNRLIRPDDGTYSYAFSPEIANDSEIRAYQERVLEVTTDATGGRIHFTPTASYDQAQVKFIINAADPNIAGNLAVNYLNLNGNKILGGTIVIRDRLYALTNVPLHEMGHFLGLGHSVDPQDTMHVPGRDYFRLSFSGAETATWAAMHNRPQGNSWEDNSQTATAFASSVSRTIIISD